MAEFQRVDLQKFLKKPLTAPDKTDKTSTPLSPALPHAEASKDFVERLPWQLERLVSAATNDDLTIVMRGVPDINRYVMAWASTYLVGGREEAKRRLWQVQRLRDPF